MIIIIINMLFHLTILLFQFTIINYFYQFLKIYYNFIILIVYLINFVFQFLNFINLIFIHVINLKYYKNLILNYEFQYFFLLILNSFIFIIILFKIKF